MLSTGSDGFLAAIGSNTYVWISLVLLLTVPFRVPEHTLAVDATAS